MGDFIVNTIIWTLALYGLFEIIKEVIYMYTYTRLKSDGTYLLIVTKNQEKYIENFIRTILFKIIYGKEECLKNIIVVDLNSTDNTKEILNRMVKDNDNLKCISWRECKEIMDNINNS